MMGGRTAPVTKLHQQRKGPANQRGGSEAFLEDCVAMVGSGAQKPRRLSKILRDVHQDTRPNALGTHFHLFAGAPRSNAHLLNVGQPDFLILVVRVTDAVPYLRSFSANFTLPGHFPAFPTNV